MKRIIILLITTGTVISASYTGLWVYVRNSFPEAKLKESFVEGVQNGTGKAVRIDRLTLTPFFHIQIVNLQLSSTDDFNDNEHLIDIPLLKLDTGLLSFLSGELTIDSIRIGDGFRFYLHTGKDLTSVKKILSSFHAFFRSLPNTSFPLRIEGKGGELIIPYLDEEKRTEVFAKLNLSLTIREKGGVTGRISGKLFNRESDRKPGQYLANFTIPPGKKNDSNYFIKWNGLDSRLLKALLPDKEKWPHKVSGYLDGECNLTSGKGYTLDFDVSGEKLSFLWDRLNISVRSLPFSLSGTLERPSDSRGKISSMECIIQNQKIILSAAWDLEEDALSVDISAGTFSLDDLRNHVSFYGYMSMGGTLSLNGHYRGKLTSLEPESFSLNSKASGISLGSPGRQYRESIVLSNGKWQIDANMKEIQFRLFTMIDDSDVRVDSATRIEGWAPLMSDSRVEIFSDHMNASLPARGIIMALGKLYEEAHRDHRRGYEQVNFLRLSEGKLINQNDIQLDIIIDKLMIGEKAHLQENELGLKLSRGRCDIMQFNCEGFGATSSLNGGAFMNREYPFFAIDFSLQNFDFEKYNQVEENYPIERGKLDVSMEFEMSAFRLAHLYQNGRGEMTFTLRDATLNSTSLQKRVNRYLFELEGENTGIEELKNIRIATFSLRHRAKEIYLRPLRLESDKTTISGYGTWTYVDKLDGKVTLNIHGEDLRKTYPLSLSGSIDEPWLSDVRGSEKRVRLFNIH